MSASLSRPGDGRVGVWLVGARGSVATTTVTGAGAVVAGLAPPTGLVTLSEPFADAGLPELSDLVFGGHDVVEIPLALRAARLVDDGVIPHGLPAAVDAHLTAVEAEQRPGIGWLEAQTEPRAAVDRAAADLKDFRARHDLDRVVVVNLCSTEPPVDPHPAHDDPDDLPTRSRPAGPCSRRAPCTRSRRSRRAARSSTSRPRRARGCRRWRRSPRARRAAGGPRRQDRRDAGQDRARADVRGARPAGALVGGDQPARRRRRRLARRAGSGALEAGLEGPLRRGDPRLHGRVAGQDRPRRAIWGSGRRPGTTSRSRASSASGCSMQFTWEGCDSALAAPLVLDLARLAALALERGEAGELAGARFLLQGPGGHRRPPLHEQYRISPG